MKLNMKDFEQHLLAHHSGHVHPEPGTTTSSGSSRRRLQSASRHFSFRQPCLSTSELKAEAKKWQDESEASNAELTYLKVQKRHFLIRKTQNQSRRFAKTGSGETQRKLTQKTVFGCV